MPSLRSAIARTILWVVATLVATSIGVHEFARHSEIETRDHVALQQMGAVLSHYARFDRNASAAGHDDACRRLLDEQVVLGVQLYDADGTLLGSAAKTEQVLLQVNEQVLRLRPTSHPGTYSGRFGDPGAGFYVVDVHANEANANSAGALAAAGRPFFRYAIQWPQPNQLWHQRIWIYMAPILAIGAIGSAFGVGALYRVIANPILYLQSLAQSRSGPLNEESASSTYREFQPIAHALRALRSDRDAWQQKAESSARSMDTRVAQRTQEINAEMRRMKRETWTDPLTGLGNRRVLEEGFEFIFESQKLANQELAVMMIDLDRFKLLNDEFGHAFGDEVIIVTAELIRSSLRQSDLAVRYGGDEFLLVLPGCAVSDASRIAERLLALFRQRAMTMPASHRSMGISVGIACLRSHDPANAPELIQLADQALYEAKKSGRGCVRVFAADTVHAAGRRSPSQVSAGRA